MKTFHQFVSEAGQITFSKRLGNKNQPGSGDFSVGANYGGLGFSVDRKTTSGGQGDRITQGVTQAIKNPGTSLSTSSAPTTSTSPSITTPNPLKPSETSKFNKKNVKTGIDLLKDIQK